MLIQSAQLRKLRIGQPGNRGLVHGQQCCIDFLILLVLRSVIATPLDERRKQAKQFSFIVQCGVPVTYPGIGIKCLAEPFKLRKFSGFDTTVRKRGKYFLHGAAGEMDPEKAGELAISAIELVLTGDVSSDDAMIDLFLEPIKVINERNQHNYEVKV